MFEVEPNNAAALAVGMWAKGFHDCEGQLTAHRHRQYTDHRLALSKRASEPVRGLIEDCT
jgi:hypothetical protein